MMGDAGRGGGEMLSPLPGQVENKVEGVTGHGAYDRRKVYQVLADQVLYAQVHLPPRDDAEIWQRKNSADPPLPRDEDPRSSYIREVGRKRWKQDSGYHRRSLAETAMFRITTRFGVHYSIVVSIHRPPKSGFTAVRSTTGRTWECMEATWRSPVPGEKSPGKGEWVYFLSLCNNARSSYNRSDVAIPIKMIPSHLLPATESCYDRNPAHFHTCRPLA
jgi:hypothetical protein